MPGIASNRFVSSSAIARRSSETVEPETIASAIFGPAADRDQLLEQVALRAVGEAVERQGVLSHDEIRLHDDLVGAVGTPQRARRRGDEVPHPVDVDDKPLRPARDGLPAQPCDHDAIAFSSGGASAWQIATASASAACDGVGAAFSPRIA